MTATDGHWHQLSSFGAAQIDGHPEAVVLALDGQDGARHRFVTDIEALEQIADALAGEVQRLRGGEVH